ncbi:hypothetical protein L4D09_24895 [Photobacterium makurazakiensis]|uniref:hypothetical protein n=1 Tax=Photobacterium makurazakiensis TaxID=2910234 RepID=UPI003D0B23E4
MKKLNGAVVIYIGLFCLQNHAYSRDLALNELGHISEINYGFDNYAYIKVSNGNSNLATITQKSVIGLSNNKAAISQSGNNNKAIIHQRGAYNKAVIQQDGYSNHAYISENGYDNTAIILQAGYNNKATIVQKGNGNEGEISQYGNDNTALIVQKSNVKSFKSQVTQTGGQTHVIINGMNRNIVID